MKVELRLTGILTDRDGNSVDANIDDVALEVEEHLANVRVIGEKYQIVNCEVTTD